MKSPIGNTPTGQIRAVGVAWYREADYAAVLGIMLDAANMQRTFKPWHDIMRKKERQLQAQGFVVYRAIIDPQTFPAWCAARGHKVDASGRTAFAAEYAARQIGQ